VKSLMAAFVFCMCVLSSSGMCSGTNASPDTTLYFILGRVSAAIFGERLEELMRSRSIADTIEQTVLGQGQIEFHAKTVSALIDSASIEEKLAYLKGAYIREGLGGRANSDKEILMRFANTAYKRDVVARFLRDLGCTDIEVTIHENCIPVGSVLSFRPSDIIQIRVIDEAIRDCNSYGGIH